MFSQGYFLDEQPPPIDWYTPLTFAIEMGNYEIIEELSKRSSPDFSHNRHAILKANEKNDTKAVEILEKYGF